MTDKGPPPWRNAAFMRLWLAQAISQTAQNISNFGLLVLVASREQSSTHVSLAVLTVVLPSVALGLVAGAMVDRGDKRTVLIWTNVTRAVVVLGFVVFADNVWLVFSVNLLFSIISQFFTPAEAAAIPTLVRREGLLQANSLFNLTFVAAQGVGFVLGGPLLLGLFGLDGLFWTVAISLAGCGLLLWPLPSMRVIAPNSAERVLWSDVLEVIAYLRADGQTLLASLQWTLAGTLLLVFATLGPALAAEYFGLSPEWTVFVLAPAGLGAVAGSLIVNRLDKRLAGPTMIAWSLFALGVAVTAIGVVPALDSVPLMTVVGVLAGVAGIAFVGVVVPAQTIVQERAEPGLRARVFAAQLLLSNAASVVPLLLAGQAADAIGLQSTLVGIGTLVISAAALSLARR